MTFISTVYVFSVITLRHGFVRDEELYKKIAWIAIKAANFFAIFLMTDQIIGFLH
ncbi:hypothetical protein [Enterococcus gilvus]|uniref:hypothetical protein n=1 Tax=Enterococcus gilvus TaxID=160453 RepID=UPI00290DAB6F|nr:hypothetical protein [Enterococcus gilvus]MDU5512025.1 hypothetical protein [Enterococcus gilvus]